MHNLIRIPEVQYGLQQEHLLTKMQVYSVRVHRTICILQHSLVSLQLDSVNYIVKTY
jgi:hypothetical protein